MRHFYKKIVSYNPIKSIVTAYVGISEDDIFNTRQHDQAFNGVWEKSNHIEEVVLGLTVTNDMYQLSETSYGYVKEDYYSAGTIKKGSVLRAIDQFRIENRIAFD